MYKMGMGIPPCSDCWMLPPSQGYGAPRVTGCLLVRSGNHDLPGMQDSECQRSREQRE